LLTRQSLPPARAKAIEESMLSAVQGKPDGAAVAVGKEA
jgi:hypothetical protein